MDFNDYLKTSAQEIDQGLDKFFKKWSREVKSISPKLKELNNTFIQACEGGKRLRGTLVKLGYELVAGPNPEILKPAAAFEIFQTAILAHDDIIDQSSLRRGRPTVYQALGGNHYGTCQTICLGDMGFYLASQLITQSNFSYHLKIKALEHFNQTMLDTALGEILDVEIPHIGKKGIEKDALTIFRLKTAKYTIVGPLQLGAILAGADQKTLDDIKSFGESLGIAFQIQDDILGVFGDEKTIGKSVTSDIEEGKNTLLIIYALKNASLKQKKILQKYYGTGKISKDKLEQIKRVFVDTGALEYSQKKAEKLVADAKKIIPHPILSQMADLLVQRQN